MMTTEQDEIVLVENTKDQPDHVVRYLLGNQKFYSGEQELLQKWIFTLP